MGWRIISKLQSCADEAGMQNQPRATDPVHPDERLAKDASIKSGLRNAYGCLSARRASRALNSLTTSLLVFTLFSMGGPAYASEPNRQAVTLGTGAIAKVVRARDDTWVVMVHGWGGVLDEVGDLYLRQAERLSASGISSIRMQIQGEGEALARGEPLDSTFSSRVADARAGLAWVWNHYPNASVGLLGFSYGGPTVMRIAVSAERPIESMVLWSSALNPLDILNDESQAGAVKAALETGVGTFQSWMPIPVTRRHVLGMLGESILPEMSAFSGALLAIRGSKDFLPQGDALILNASRASKKEALLIEGASHIFNVVEADQTRGNQRYAEQVLESTTQWFEDTLLKTR